MITLLYDEYNQLHDKFHYILLYILFYYIFYLFLLYICKQEVIRLKRVEGSSPSAGVFFRIQMNYPERVFLRKWIPLNSNPVY